MSQHPEPPYAPRQANSQQQPGWQPSPPVPYQQPMPYQPHHYPMQVRPKNPGLALLASCFIPGLGSWVVGRIDMGILIFTASFISWLLFWLLIAVGAGIIFLIPAFATWVWGMYDGYHGATKWNAAHGVAS